MISTTQELRTAMLVFLRYENAEVSTVGVLLLRTAIEQDAEVKQALMAATTHWVNTTEDGRKIWRYSCCDLNIGDLACSSAFQSPAFLAALQERGVEYLDCIVVDTTDALAYDTVLVNEAQVIETETEGSPS